MRRAFCILSMLLPVLVAAPATAQTIDVSLNVFYSNPANVNSGGTWELVAKSGNFGIAGVSLLVTNITSAQNEAPRETVNGSDLAGFGLFSNTPHPLGFRNLTIGQVPIPAANLGPADEQSIFYGVGTLANGAPGAIGPAFASLANVVDVPWATGDAFSNPAWATAARLASGTFAAGLTPGFFAASGELAPDGNVFTSVPPTNRTYGSLADAAITTIVRTNFANMLPGDYNANGVVDAADYVLWRNGGPLLNDPTSGVQPGDYDVWRANFGKVAGAGAATDHLSTIRANAGAAVPEPASWMLLVVCGALWMAGSRQVGRCGFSPPSDRFARTWRQANLKIFSSLGPGAAPPARPIL
jgi:hypothetical protein